MMSFILRYRQKMCGACRCGSRQKKLLTTRFTRKAQGTQRLVTIQQTLVYLEPLLCPLWLNNGAVSITSTDHLSPYAHFET